MRKKKSSNALSRYIAKHRILRAFSKKRVDYSDVVKDFYIEDGLAYISCNVKEYNEVIDRYSVREYEWPNAEFLRFVEDNAYYIPSEYPIVLEISGKHFTSRQQHIIKETLESYYALRLGDTQLDVESNRFKEIVLLLFTIIAALCLIAFWMFNGGEGLLQETLLIIFWFFLWEWGDVIVFERREIHMKRNDASQLASMKIMFSDRFIDVPLDEETKEEIIGEIIGKDEGE